MRLAPFAGLELITAPGLVMTPRPASVALVERALQHIGERDAIVVDAGTGSGAIAIAIARAAPPARVWATDVSGEAGGRAPRNAPRHRVRESGPPRRPLAPVPAALHGVGAALPHRPRA